MSAKLVELRDYEALRRHTEAAVERIDVDAELLVLGSSQSTDVLVASRTASIPVRQRRGGGGVVLLRPRDLWIDVWIPRDHDEWTPDVREQSVRVGRWWLEALSNLGAANLAQYAVDESASVTVSVACFATSAPGEVVSSSGKVVGLTQWRPREGALVSGVLIYGDSRDLADMVVGPVDLVDTLQHPGLVSLGLDDSTGEIAASIARHLDVALTRRPLT